MNKVFVLLGIGFLIAIGLAISGIVFLAIKGSALDKESKQYVDAAITSIVSGWSKQELVVRASPELLAATTNDDLNRLFRLFRKLGKLKEYKGSEGQANISLTTQEGRVISAKYVGKAEFDAGAAEIKVTLIKHSDKWQILGFDINSKVFFEQQG